MDIGQGKLDQAFQAPAGLADDEHPRQGLEDRVERRCVAAQEATHEPCSLGAGWAAAEARRDRPVGDARQEPVHRGGICAPGRRNGQVMRQEVRIAARVDHDVGYDSEAAFSRAFKKATGVAPGAWRDGHVANRDER